MSAPSPEFAREEYERRLATVQRGLAERELDALVVADEPNYRYLTGHYTESWLNRTRPAACWVPREGEPCLVVCETDERWARATSWCSQIVSYAGPVRGPEVLGAPEVGFEPLLVDALVRGARSTGVSGAARVGLPQGSRSRVQLPLGVVLALREALAGAEWVDAVDVMWRTRAIKSEPEIERMRAAVAALDHALPATLSAAREGMTELELASIERRELFDGGAHHAGYTNVVADLDGPLFSAPSDRTLAAGRPFYVDGGAVVNGYWSDYCRLAVVGEPSADAASAYRVMVDALDAGLDAIAAGVRAGDVAAAMASVLAEAGDDAGIGRMGHANGLEMPEPPSLHVDDDTLLAAGMVLAVEPNARFDGLGSLVVEDMVVVREEGCEPLSVRPTPRELTVV